MLFPSIARKPYASQALLDIVAQRVPLKKEMSIISDIIASVCTSNSVSDTDLCVLECYKSSIKLLLRALRKALKRQSKHDFSVFTLDVAADLSPTAIVADPSLAWQTLKFLMSVTGNNKFTPSRALPMTVDAAGAPVTNMRQSLNVQLEHFAAVELAQTNVPRGPC